MRIDGLGQVAMAHVGNLPQRFDLDLPFVFPLTFVTTLSKLVDLEISLQLHRDDNERWLVGVHLKNTKILHKTFMFISSDAYRHEYKPPSSSFILVSYKRRKGRGSGVGAV
jgi:hypothetical protein